MPWLTWPALTHIKSWGDLSTKRVLEWGSGGSTLYWSDRGVAELVTIEHDAQWADQVGVALGRPHAKHNVFLVPPEPLSTPGYGSDILPGLSFQRYATWPTELGYSPHIVLVDGRARPACLALASQIALDAVILDNSERARYATAAQECGARLHERGFGGPTTYTGGGPYSPGATWSTTFWERTVA